jgi:hypothetical protein
MLLSIFTLYIKNLNTGPKIKSEIAQRVGKMAQIREKRPPIAWLNGQKSIGSVQNGERSREWFSVDINGLK